MWVRYAYQIRRSSPLIYRGGLPQLSGNRYVESLSKCDRHSRCALETCVRIFGDAFQNDLRKCRGNSTVDESRWCWGVLIVPHEDSHRRVAPKGWDAGGHFIE